MKKNRINIISLWMMMLMTIVSFGFVSCSDDDSAGGTPEITGIKILTSDTINYSYDQTYSKASAGTMIAIMGTNLGGTTKVLINDQEVYVNPTMNTDHSIIVTVPSEEDGFKLSTFDSSVKDQIEVVTSHGTAVYAFKITAPGAQLQRIDAKYPRNAGDTLLLNGLNLVDIEKVYFTDVMGDALDTTVWTEAPGNKTEITKYWDVKQDHHLSSSTSSYVTTSVVGAIVPENAPDSGAIVIQCASGNSYVNYYKLPGKPTIKSISSDMPQIGENLVITGSNLLLLENITYGDVTLSPDEFIVAETQDSITIPFKKIPSASTGVELKVTTQSGSCSVSNFYDKSTILTTFDGDATDNGWGPNATYPSAGNADGNYAYFYVEKEAQQWWGTMVYFRKDWNGNSFSFSDNIPATATADHIYLSYEVNDNSDYNNGSFWGFIRYSIWSATNTSAEIDYDNFGWEDYKNGIGMYPDGPVFQDINGKAHKNQWYRAVVPLSKFSIYNGKTMAEIRTIGLNEFRIQDINSSTSTGKIDFKIDNVRIIYIP